MVRADHGRCAAAGGKRLAPRPSKRGFRKCALQTLPKMRVANPSENARCQAVAIFCYTQRRKARPNLQTPTAASAPEFQKMRVETGRNAARYAKERCHPSRASRTTRIFGSRRRNRWPWPKQAPALATTEKSPNAEFRNGA